MYRDLSATLLFFILFFVPLVPVNAAQTYHISDDVSVPLRSGPTPGYRIRRSMDSGTPVTILARNDETGYVHVKSADGKEGWLEKKYVIQGDSFRARLPALEQGLKKSQATVAAQAEEIETLRAELNQARERGAKSTAETAQLQNEIDRLGAAIEGTDERNLMGWFVRGAAVAGIGLVVGLIIPRLPQRRRRTEEWF